VLRSPRLIHRLVDQGWHASNVAGHVGISRATASSWSARLDPGRGGMLDLSAPSATLAAATGGGSRGPVPCARANRSRRLDRVHPGRAHARGALASAALEIRPPISHSSGIWMKRIQTAKRIRLCSLHGACGVLDRQAMAPPSGSSGPCSGSGRTDGPRTSLGIACGAALGAVAGPSAPAAPSRCRTMRASPSDARA
jgi:hypothetical protein